ncbi:hypothetical protein [Aliterella atlantica]|uniref:hypothetical protein n=1 Tax=Aliterella atlantica TaxID=1827278 RepID=UPI0030DD0141
MRNEKIDLLRFIGLSMIIFAHVVRSRCSCKVLFPLIGEVLSFLVNCGDCLKKRSVNI